MFSFTANDVNEALHFGLVHLLSHGVEESSRNGSVIVAPQPVCITYSNPRRRVLLSATRDSNPFFSFFESLWMLAGDNDIEFPCFFNSTYGQFSDDGKTMWDAYGYRWRNFFGWDQLDAIVTELKANPASRRCVLSMWNGMPVTEDNGYDIKYDNDFHVATHGGKAVPCNTHAYFAIRNGALNMTVCNRSNDAVWGAFGANAVHFSFLLEYMAMRVGVSVGVYHQFTNNLHAYTDKFNRAKLEQIAHESDTLGKLPDLSPALEPGFDADLKVFMEWAREFINIEVPPTTVEMGGPVPPAWLLASNIPDLKTGFMSAVAVPMFLAWVYRKWKDEYSMTACLSGIEADDWRTACEEWIDRRSKKSA